MEVADILRRAGITVPDVRAVDLERYKQCYFVWSPCAENLLIETTITHHTTVKKPLQKNQLKHVTYVGEMTEEEEEQKFEWTRILL